MMSRFEVERDAVVLRATGSARALSNQCREQVGGTYQLPLAVAQQTMAAARSEWSGH